MSKQRKAVVKKKQQKVTKDRITVASDLLLRGDLSGLTSEEKLAHYMQLCKYFRLNPLTKPFDYIVLNGKEILYANKNTAEQLRSNLGISVTEVTPTITDTVIMVTVRVQDKNGRSDSGIGVVPTVIWDARAKSMRKLTPEEYANAIMKAETKAKRRATLSLAGLGMLDESEFDTIPATAYHKPPTSSEALHQEKSSNIDDFLDGNNQTSKVDVVKRQVLINKLKKVPAPIKALLHKKGYDIDGQMKFCEEHNWDKEALYAALQDTQDRNEEVLYAIPKDTQDWDDEALYSALQGTDSDTDEF